MKKLNVEAKKMSEGGQIPVDGYVVSILSAKVEETDYGEKLAIGFDIAEGEYKDFYKRKFDSDTSEDKKWKGVIRINVPDEKNQYYDTQKRVFGNFLACVEESNEGYHWDWDEKKLKGKTVGCIFRNEEWEIGGRSGWKSQPYKFISAEKIRSGDFKIPDDKAKSSKTSAGSVNTDLSNFEEITTSNSDLPFDI